MRKSSCSVLNVSLSSGLYDAAVFASFSGSSIRCAQKHTSGSNISYAYTRTPSVARVSSIEPPPTKGEHSSFILFGKWGKMCLTALVLPPGYLSGDFKFASVYQSLVSVLILVVSGADSHFALIVIIFSPSAFTPIVPPATGSNVILPV